MIRGIVSYHLAEKVRCSCMTFVPIRWHPRRAPTFSPPDALEAEDIGDAFDESDITSGLDQMDDSLQYQRFNEEIQKEKQRKWLKNKIIQRKYFKEPKELNLLSWTAKAQIRYLHAEQPELWTVQKLAESFPISEKGVIKILKSDFITYSQKKIDKHDMQVRRRWQQIGMELHQADNMSQLNEGGPISEAARRLIESEKLPLMINAGGMGNVNLPQRIQTERKKVGLFESLVKDYVDTDSKVNQDINLETPDSKELLRDISEFRTSDAETSSASPEQTYVQTSENMGDHERRHVSRRQRRLDQSIEDGTFGKALPDDSSANKLGLHGTGKLPSKEKKYDPITDSNHGNRPDLNYSENVRYKQNKKKLDVLSKIKFDEHQMEEDGNADGYIYNSQSGYQYPLGRSDKNLERLQVPKSNQLKGDLYVKGKYVYDEDGEFLYKIP